MENKLIVWLRLGRRHAVVIDWNVEEARSRAWLHDPKSDWEAAEALVICHVRRTRTSMVLAMDGGHPAG